MIRKPCIALAFLGAVFGSLDTARAGLGSITYDWVTPDWNLFGQGSHITGSITVDSTGISSTPTDLTPSMIATATWQISFISNNSQNNFSLSSSASDTLLVPGAALPPKITTTSIFLPAISSGVAAEFLAEDAGSLHSILWLGRPNSISVGVFLNNGLAMFTGPGDTVLTIATAEATTPIPEPGSLAIASLGVASVAGWFGVGRIRKRRRVSAAAV